MCSVRIFIALILIEGKYGMFLNRYSWKKKGHDGVGARKRNTAALDEDKSQLLKLNVSDEIRNLTMLYRIKNLLDLLPEKVAISKEEAVRKKKMLESELVKKRKELQGKTDCPVLPMPQSLKKRLTSYINKTVNHVEANCSVNKGNNVESKVSRSELLRSVSSTKCQSEEIKSFTCRPVVEIQNLGDRYYPNHVIHEKCSECTKCMYGSGQCHQRSITIRVYYDQDEDGFENLYSWEERIHTVYTGCRCRVSSDNTIIRILDTICGQLGGDPVSDPVHCFRDKQLFQPEYENSWSSVP